MANPFTHLELSTDDVQASRKFYKKLFDWKFNDLGPDMGNYVLIDFGKRDSGGGITPKMMPNQPTGWLAYVEVDSVKKTIAKAAAAGAEIVVPFQEIGEMGAIGIFVDPAGAPLGIWEKTKPTKKAAKKAASKKAPAKKVAAKKTVAKKRR